MKKFYEDYKSRTSKENNLKQNKYQITKNIKELDNNKIGHQMNKGKPDNINNSTSHNYLQQTASSLSKIKKSNTSEKNKSLNKNINNNNNCNKSQIYLYSQSQEIRQPDKFNTKNINNNNSQKRKSNILNNQKNHINQNSNRGNEKDKNLYRTAQNFYNNFPNPEPMPIKVNCNYNKFNDLNKKGENNYNEKIIYNNKKEDNNILYLLSNLNLENLYDSFISNYISFNDLFLLTKVDFIEMKIPIGPRNRILHFIYEYQKIGKTYDFQELSNFMNCYKKNINKPLISDLNNSGLFITTNNINNGSFNCYNRPIINNFLNNQNNEQNNIIKKENIEKTNLFLDNKEKEIINSKNLSNNNNNNSSTNDLINLINYSKEKNKCNNNTSESKLRKYNSFNSSKKDMVNNSTISENINCNYNNINFDNFNKESKNNNIKTISSKNLKKYPLKNNLIKDENSKQCSHRHKNYYNNKKVYNKNIFIKNSNNSNYLLAKFQNINKEVNKFQKNFSKIQKSAKNIDEKIFNFFSSPKYSQINEELIYYMNNDLENENIRNLNNELKHSYMGKY